MRGQAQPCCSLQRAAAHHPAGLRSAGKNRPSLFHAKRMSSPQPASLEEGRGDGQDERAGLLENVVGRQTSLRVTEHELDIVDDMSCSIPAIAEVGGDSAMCRWQACAGTVPCCS